MTPAMERDIDATKAILAKLADKLASYPPEVLADLGSHMRAIGKQADCIVDGWERGKELERPGIKQLLRPKAKPVPKGFAVVGETFMALYSPGTMNVLDQSALREAHPDLVAKFTRPVATERLNFKVRDC